MNLGFTFNYVPVLIRRQWARYFLGIFISSHVFSRVNLKFGRQFCITWSSIFRRQIWSSALWSWVCLSVWIRIRNPPSQSGLINIPISYLLRRSPPNLWMERGRRSDRSSGSGGEAKTMICCCYCVGLGSCRNAFRPTTLPRPMLKRLITFLKYEKMSYLLNRHILIVMRLWGTLPSL